MSQLMQSFSQGGGAPVFGPSSGGINLPSQPAGAMRSSQMTPGAIVNPSLGGSGGGSKLGSLPMIGQMMNAMGGQSGGGGSNSTNLSPAMLAMMIPYLMAG